MTPSRQPHDRSSARIRIYGLYVIIDPQITNGRTPIDIATAALRGGARVIQIRDKDSDKGKTLKLAKGLAFLCDSYKIPLIINDHPDIAMITMAGGVHLGQGDLPIRDTRLLIYPDQIIGRSNYLLDEAIESQAQGADYIAIGNIYRTKTKESIINRTPLGPDAIRAIRPHIKVPIVAIGGINESNVGSIINAGADSVCVAAAVGLADDPEQATRTLINRIIDAGGRA